jgi:hypothetical protein
VVDYSAGERARQVSRRLVNDVATLGDQDRSTELPLDRPVSHPMKVPGEISENWSDWVEGMTITVESESEGPPVTTLTGTLDQAALQGLLRRLYSRGLPLISAHCAHLQTIRPCTPASLMISGPQEPGVR